MNDIKKYREASIDYRRLFSNMLRMDHTDGLIPMIRLKKYMDENEIIRELIERKIKNSSYDYKESFIVSDGHGGWKFIDPPVCEDDHIKAMYDYLSEICSSEKDLRGIAQGFYYSVKHSKYDDMIRSFLEKAFKPLSDYVVDSLSKEIIFLEEGSLKGGIVQNIGTNYGTTNIANRDIHSVNTAEKSDLEDVVKLIEAIRETVVKCPVSEETRDNVIDDLEIIQEQIKSSEPKTARIKKACESMYQLLLGAPTAVESGTKLISNSQELVEKLKTIFGF